MNWEITYIINGKKNINIINLNTLDSDKVKKWFISNINDILNKDINICDLYKIKILETKIIL